MNDFVELPLETLCPCGSDLAYGECCSLKQYKYGYDSDGNPVRSVPLAEGALDAFSEAADEFFHLYGRRPAGKDLAFGHMTDPTESVFTVARSMLKAGLPHEFAYAYTRTDGLLPTETNQDLISDVDLDVFQHYVDEYLEGSAEPVSSRGTSSLAFVRFGNEFLLESVTEASRQLTMIVTDFLSRHLSEEDRSGRMEPSMRKATAFKVRSPADYCLFSAVKTKRTLESLERLLDADADESVYALARSVFENTLFLDAVADDVSVFRDNISPKVDEDNYTFTSGPDGRVNYSHVIHRTTGVRANVNVRVSELARRPTAAPHTAELYSLFYVTACQFVHVDVLSAKAYFDDPDPFDQLDPNLIALLVAMVLIGDFVRALVRVDGVQPQFRSDVVHALAHLSDLLGKTLELAASDPDHPNEVLVTLQRVTTSWR